MRREPLSVQSAVGEGLAIQVVSFDWPWPPNYGGVIDVYYRIDALLAAGVAVRLHVVAFDDRRASMPEHWRLAGIEVFAHRRRGAWSALSRKPYITASRAVGSLLPNLANGAPVILFEGIHCCGFLGHPRLGDRAQWVRVHNVEADYYRQLSETAKTTGEGSAVERLYYRREARRLRRYEGRVLAQADLLLPISAADVPYCEIVGGPAVMLHTAYVPSSEIATSLGRGDYVLFHAGFQVRDNVTVARWLIECLADRPDRPLLIAGRGALAAVGAMVGHYAHIKVVDTPSAAEMAALLQGAQVVVTWAQHAAGFKVKLLESLLAARFVVVNKTMLAGAPGLSSLVQIASDRASLLREVDAAWDVSIGSETVSARRKILEPYMRPALSTALIDRLRSETFTRN